MREEKMRSLRLTLIIVALALSLMASGVASADRSSGGGGHQGGYYRGGGHQGGYYRGGDHQGGYYRGNVGVVIGGPFWGSPWYNQSYYYPYQPYYYPPYQPYNYPYYAPTVEVPAEPPVYIERYQSKPSSTPSGVWYYCSDSKTYYPYVKECPGGWQTVPAEPPSEQAR